MKTDLDTLNGFLQYADSGGTLLKDLRPLLQALAGDPPAGFPETRRLAIISTSHMSKEDYKHASQHAFYVEPLIISSGRNCIILRAPGEGDEQPQWMSGGLWSNLRALAAMGFERIEFDGDAPIIPTLQQHDW